MFRHDAGLGTPSLGAVALLDEAQGIGFLGHVSDAGEFWATPSLELQVQLADA